MKIAKFFIALALFVTSVTFQEQVIMTKNGIDVSWDVTVSTQVSHAAMEAMANENLL